MSGDPSDGIADKTWGESSKKSFKSAQTHFNLFLTLYVAQHPAVGTSLFGETVPVNPTYEAAKKENINIELFDHFGKYLCNTAINLRNPDADGLSFECASRYFSSMKNGLFKHFIYEPEKLQLNESSLKKIRDGMLNSFVQKVMLTNSSLSNSHKESSVEDLQRIVSLCLWENTFQHANFAFYIISLFQLAGRGAEVAVLPFRRLTMYQPAEFSGEGRTAGSDKIAKVQLWRTKLKKEQSLTIFNHRDHCFLDWYFLMAYSMIMDENPEPTESMFPTFISKGAAVRAASAAVNEAREAVEAEVAANVAQAERQGCKEGVKAKGVSKYFTDMMVYLAKSAQYLEELDFDEDEEQEDDADRAHPGQASYRGTFFKDGL